MLGFVIGVIMWIFAVFANYLRWDLTGIWWQNVILYASLQTIGTALIMKKLGLGGRR